MDFGSALNEIGATVKLPDSYEELDALAEDTTGSICFSCYEFESFNGQEPYSVCFECGHVYLTKQDLIRLYERDVDWSWEGDPDDIAFCPSCCHDW